MKKRVVMLLSIVLLLFQTLFVWGETVKDETVYVRLKADGTPKEITVINRFSGIPEGESFRDYGKYDKVRVLVPNLQADYKDGIAELPAAYLKNNDIYIEGRLTKELPIDIKISYFLNGQQMKAEDCLGKSGDFRLEIEIKRSEVFATQIQVPLDLSKFTDIKTESGVLSVVGSTMTVVFNHLPLGDEIFSLDAKVENLELEPFLISSNKLEMKIPGSFNAEIETFEQGLKEMIQGAETMTFASSALANGSRSLSYGLKQMSDSIAPMVSGVSEIGKNADLLKEGLLKIGSGLGTFRDEMVKLVDVIKKTNLGLKELAKNGMLFKKGMPETVAQSVQLKEGLHQFQTELEALSKGREELTQTANQLSQHADEKVRLLAKAILAEKEGLAKLYSSAQQFLPAMDAFVQGSETLSTGLQDFVDGVSQTSAGMNILAEQIQPLPENAAQMASGYNELTSGLSPLLSGMGEMSNGLGILYSNLQELPVKILKMAEGQDHLTKGISDLSEQGLKTIQNKLSEIDTLGSLTKAESYHSFVDNENNLAANIQFIMKTDGLKQEKPIKSFSATEKKESLWDRIKKIFQ